MPQQRYDAAHNTLWIDRPTAPDISATTIRQWRAWLKKGHLDDGRPLAAIRCLFATSAEAAPHYQRLAYARIGTFYGQPPRPYTPPAGPLIIEDRVDFGLDED